MNTAEVLDIVQEIEDQQVYNLPVDMIYPNPFQPRRFFDPTALVDLATSIKQYGLVQPICVRITEQGYELVAGERRLRASKLADLSTIRAIVVDISEEESAILAMVENMQRQNLNYIEEAEGYYQLISYHNLTQEDLARRLGRNQSTVANKLRLLKLPPKIKRLLVEHDLSERHARALLLAQRGRNCAEAEHVMVEIIERIVDEGLTVLKTEELIDKISRQSRKKASSKANIKTYVRDVRIFTNTIRQAVGVMRDSGFDADYDVEESADGCVITVLVKY